MSEIKIPVNAEVFIHELRNLQLVKESSLYTLHTDVEVPGIVLFPVGVAVGDSRNFVITQNGTDPTKIDVGFIQGNETGGVAITVEGKRIAIPVNKMCVVGTPPNIAPQTFTPPSAAYSTTDPYSNTLLQTTGNIAIPINASADNYVWIDYIQAVDSNITTTVADANDPSLIWYTKYDDGYQLIVLTSPGAPSGHPNAIFLGKVTTVGTAITLIDQTGQSYATRRGITVAGNTNDITTVPAIYQDNTVVTFDDHIHARGSGIITPRNPHGLVALDLGITPDSTVSTHLQYYHFNGLTNVSDPIGITTSALFPSINTTHIRIQGLATTEFLTIQGTSYSANSAITAITTTSPGGTATFFSFSPIGYYDSGDFTAVSAPLGTTYYFYIDGSIPTSPRILYTASAAIVNNPINFVICSAIWNSTLVAWSNLVDYRTFENHTRQDIWGTTIRNATPYTVSGNLGFNRDTSGFEGYDGTNWITFTKEFFSIEYSGSTSYTIAHGLGVAPDIVIVTLRSGVAGGGTPYHGAWEVAPADATNVYLNTTVAAVKFKVYAKYNSKFYPIT